MTEHLFLYGTLLPELIRPELRPLLRGLIPVGSGRVRGRLYDLGAFPGAVVDAECDSWILGRIFVLPSAPDRLMALDRHEGYFPDQPERSLFLRIRKLVERPGFGFIDSWLYAYNRPIGTATRIESGDYVAWCHSKGN